MGEVLKDSLLKSPESVVFNRIFSSIIRFFNFYIFYFFTKIPIIRPMRHVYLVKEKNRRK